MNKKFIETYGKIRKRINANGQIEIKDIGIFKVDYSIVQFTNGNLKLFSEFRVIEFHKYLALTFIEPNIIAISGNTLDGFPIDFTNLGSLIRLVPLKNSKIILMVNIFNSCTIGNFSNEIDNKDIIFDMENFLFDSPDQKSIIDYDLNENQYNSLIIKYKTIEIEIVKNSDYDKLTEILRAQNGKEVTCKLIIKNFSGLLEELITLVDHVCEFLSIGRSTLINWVAYEVKENSENLFFGNYLNSVIKNYYGNGLIQKDYHDTIIFLQNSLALLEGLSSDFSLRKLARAFSETKGGPFLETRAMLVASSVEYITNIYNKKINLTKSCNADEKQNEILWKVANKNFINVFENNLPKISKSRRHEVLTELKRSLFSSSYSERITNLTKYLNIITSPVIISDFTKARNTLVHDGSFPKEKKPQYYYFIMQHLLDQIILKLLGYQGLYYDIEHSEIRVLE